MLNSLRGTKIKGKTMNIKLLIYFNTNFAIVHGVYTGTAWVTLKPQAGGSPHIPGVSLGPLLWGILWHPGVDLR